MRIIHSFRGKVVDSVRVEKNNDLYCPNCGNKGVYEETGDGDYYEGPSMYCIECKTEFSMPYLDNDSDIRLEDEETR